LCIIINTAAQLINENCEQNVKEMKMKAPKIDLHIVNRTSFLFSGLVSVVLLAATPVSFAATNDNTIEDTSPQTAYVDSVKKWGAWGLGIEPAAGGIQPPSTRPLKARNTNLSLRTNSISALAPVRSAAAVSPPQPPVTPPAPPFSPPSVTNISPSVPIPVGAP
jgi:hypothetical protein